jgi:type II secretory pathway pseudopilin PulG
MLLAVIFMLAMLIISLSIAVPRIAKEIQRDREVETMQRGKQYIRAVKMYYKKFGAYPPNTDALTKPTNGIRFLRKKYVDPTTGKEEWKPIRLGQNKVPTAMGFFGQPMGSSSIGGVGPGGISGATTPGSGIGSSGSGSSMFGSSSSGSMFGSSGALGTSSPQGSSGTAGISGNGTSTAGATDASGNPGTGTGLSGQTGQTFGGAGIIGFSPNSPKQSILVYKKKNHYNEWEFVYDPIMDRTTVSSSGAGAGGQSAGSMSNGIGGPGIGGSGIGGSGIGGSGIGGGMNPGGGTPTQPISPPSSPFPQ